ncbi:hypothetical protein [Clostridium sp. JN-9]|uniref:hypothetical protein n=1 Tax=Clostridium sp. JN-9 TaxID=2507159 RepID=UPI000FFE0796|nr:hypothetical protein [Clostridium sp. JN-9]QAT39767.1 hypothetical protein EQM05_05605 [Clostridium sp. JN-9]
MKKRLLSICILSSLLIFNGCSSKNNNEKATTCSPNKSEHITIQNDVKTNNPASKENEKIETIVSEANMSSRYVFFNNLVTDAEIVIEGEVLDVSYFDYNGIPRTKSQVKVTKSYNNNAKDGDVLTIIESGGITTKEKIIKYTGAADKFGIKPTDEDKNIKVKYSLGGSETMKPKDKILIFGKQSDGNFYNLAEKYYVVLGSYLGKFNIKDNKIQRFVSTKVKEDTDFDKISNINDFRKELGIRIKSK